MSTIDATDPAAILAELIRCPSVTPAEGGALALLQSLLEPMGFCVARPVFSEDGTADVENLYARLGADGPHLMFAGHTDVVPPGDEAAWTHPPFAAEVKDGRMFGRGAIDMKGGIACFIAATARALAEEKALPGSVSLLITGDEEGPSINGTDKLLKWATEKGEKWDAAIVGEPTNPERLGEAIKHGRRGSLSGIITVNGVQGHSAYPHLADNPVHALVEMLAHLLGEPFDEGTDAFEPTNLQVTSIDVGNEAVNVIPRSASARFNVRFNDNWNAQTLRAEIGRRLDAGAAAGRIRRGRDAPLDYGIEWIGRVSPVFVTRDEALIETLSKAIEQETGMQPELSTGGGTSDARFIKDYCPVIEFGLVGQTMHQIDEHAALDDLERLTRIYRAFIADWLSGKG